MGGGREGGWWGEGWGGKWINHPYRPLGVAVATWCSYNILTMSRRHSWSNGGGSRSWPPNWCSLEAPFS